MVRWHCSDCNLTMGLHMRDIHINRPTHLSKIPGMWDCSVCEQRMPIGRKIRHRGSIEHQQLQQKRRGSLPRTARKGGTIVRVPLSDPTVTLEPSTKVWTCTICCKSMPESSRISHEGGKRHLARVRASETSTVKNKGDDLTLWSAMRDTPQGQDHPNTQDARTAQPIANPIAIPKNAPIPPRPTAVSGKRREWTCEVCSRSMPKTSRRSHERGKSHLAKVGESARVSNSGTGLSTAPAKKSSSRTRKKSRAKVTTTLGEADAPDSESEDPDPIVPDFSQESAIQGKVKEWTCDICHISLGRACRSEHRRSKEHLDEKAWMTPGDVRDADHYRKTRRRLHSVDAGWKRIQKGRAYEDSDDYFGPSEWDCY